MIQENKFVVIRSTQVMARLVMMEILILVWIFVRVEVVDEEHVQRAGIIQKNEQRLVMVLILQDKPV
jgi:hypothetical protein